MLRPRFGVRTAWMSAFVATLAISSLFILLGQENRGRLGRDIVAQSRGSNTSLVLTQSSCAVLNGTTNCSSAGFGSACNVCSGNSYTNVMGGTNGGYNVGPTGGPACGNLYGGTCGPNGSGVLVCSLSIAGPLCNALGSPTIQP